MILQNHVPILSKKISIIVLTLNNELAWDTSFEGGSQLLFILNSIPITAPIILANDLRLHSGFDLLSTSFVIFIIMRGSIITTSSTLPIKAYAL